jgi:hypothetical protein
MIWYVGVRDGCRALANLTTNINSHHHLLDHDCIERILNILSILVMTVFATNTLPWVI